jgi:hypothetical protein
MYTCASRRFMQRSTTLCCFRKRLIRCLSGQSWSNLKTWRRLYLCGDDGDKINLIRYKKQKQRLRHSMQTHKQYKEKDNKANSYDECLRSHIYWSSLANCETIKGSKMLGKR